MAKEFGEITHLHDAYFSNATLQKDEKEVIVSNQLQDNLYEIIASTKIDKDGTAVDSSLREIEVVIPLTLYGEIRDIPDEFAQKVEKSLKFIKRMGLNRNRGLGRCEFRVIEESR
jgi:CRISPR/Cas system CSM-associated protein Csm4 (group 5 of RAMP superfamily)